MGAANVMIYLELNDVIAAELNKRRGKEGKRIRVCTNWGKIK